jgi:hypothetical protein
MFRGSRNRRGGRRRLRTTGIAMTIPRGQPRGGIAKRKRTIVTRGISVAEEEGVADLLIATERTTGLGTETAEALTIAKRKSGRGTRTATLATVTSRTIAGTTTALQLLSVALAKLKLRNVVRRRAMISLVESMFWCETKATRGAATAVVATADRSLGDSRRHRLLRAGRGMQRTNGTKGGMAIAGMTSAMNAERLRKRGTVLLLMSADTTGTMM